MNYLDRSFFQKKLKLKKDIFFSDLDHSITAVLEFLELFNIPELEKLENFLDFFGAFPYTGTTVGKV